MQRWICSKAGVLLDPEKVLAVLSHRSHLPDEVSPYPRTEAIPSRAVVMQDLDTLRVSDKRRVWPKPVGLRTVARAILWLVAWWSTVEEEGILIGALEGAQAILLPLLGLIIAAWGPTA